jgi:hypothetical protein
MISTDEAINLGYENKHLYQVLVPKNKFEIETVKEFLKRNLENVNLDYIINDEYYIFLQKERIRGSKFQVKKLTNSIKFIYQIY